ncbi:MAG: DHH family phosphoesterase [Bacteroidia bacterium]
MKISMLQKVKQLLGSRKKIVITTHQRPDGDAMGSSLGLYHYLTQLGHNVTVIAPTDFAAFLKWMPSVGTVMIGPFYQEKAKRFFQQTDIIFCLDFSHLSRVGEFDESVRDSPAFKIMIDHHIDPQDFANFQYWDEHASSTCELIYRFICDLGDRSMINQKVATCLYTGIMTDTGSFRFPATTPAVHRVVADLMETGIETHKIHEAIYDTNSENRIRFLGHCLSNCLTVLPEKRAAYISISKEVAQQFKIETGDAENIVNYALSIKGIDFATMMLENPDIIRLSFRSRGEFGVNTFAANFDGGGHFYASGGRSRLSLVETEQKFLTLLNELRP